MPCTSSFLTLSSYEPFFFPLRGYYRKCSALWSAQALTLIIVTGNRGCVQTLRSTFGTKKYLTGQSHNPVRIKKGYTRQAMQVSRNDETRSRNHCCRGKVISITYCECVLVAVFIQHAKRMRHIVLSSVVCPELPYFSHSLKTGTIFFKSYRI